MPRAWQASATSTAYSRKITGSLYVKATLAHPRRRAASATASGDAASASVSNSRDLEMSQFWQNRQLRLQPAVPNDRTDVPGRKWLSGFFSIGSTQKPLDRPYVVNTICSPSRARTKHSPRCPSRSLHPRGQTSHCRRPSATWCKCFVATELNDPRAVTIVMAGFNEQPAGVDLTRFGGHVGSGLCGLVLDHDG